MRTIGSELFVNDEALMGIDTRRVNQMDVDHVARHFPELSGHLPDRLYCLVRLRSAQLWLTDITRTLRRYEGSVLYWHVEQDYDVMRKRHRFEAVIRIDDSFNTTSEEEAKRVALTKNPTNPIPGTPAKSPRMKRRIPGSASPAIAAKRTISFRPQSN